MASRLVSELLQEDSSENSGGDSPRSAAMSSDTKLASTSSSRRSSSSSSRRAVQKRVVSVPIKEVEAGLRLKGDQMSAPPSDSWAWRKYGQKPIKGSPYPRGYYRCSSSKGCPARKQVERSRVDPNMLVVTYSCEHNHPWPASSRNNHHNHHHSSAAAAAANVTTSEEEEEEQLEEEQEQEQEQNQEKKPVVDPSSTSTSTSTAQSPNDPINQDYKFTSLGEGIHGGDQFGWFGDFESTTCTMLESPILAEDRIARDNEMAMIFTMREEDESLFADLGELPECSTVFRRGMVAEQRPPSLATTT